MRQLAKHLFTVNGERCYGVVKTEVFCGVQVAGGTAGRVRRMEIDRLDEMLLAIWPAVKRGDYQAINTALRISERRATTLQ